MQCQRAAEKPCGDDRQRPALQMPAWSTFASTSAWITAPRNTCARRRRADHAHQHRRRLLLTLQARACAASTSTARRSTCTVIWRSSTSGITTGSRWALMTKPARSKNDQGRSGQAVDSPMAAYFAMRIGHRDRLHRAHHRQHDREVEVAAFLRQVGGREIDGDVLIGKPQADRVRALRTRSRLSARPPCRAGPRRSRKAAAPGVTRTWTSTGRASIPIEASVEIWPYMRSPPSADSAAVLSLTNFRCDRHAQNRNTCFWRCADGWFDL